MSAPFLYWEHPLLNEGVEVLRRSRSKWGGFAGAWELQVSNAGSPERAAGGLASFLEWYGALHPKRLEARMRLPNCLAVCSCLLAMGAAVFMSAPALAVQPDQRLASMPDSWLVLYNTNSPDSIAWAEWYRLQWGVPTDHLLGLDASLDEHLPDLESVQAQIVAPVRDLLDSDPELEESVMGILLGYDLPGHYHHPPLCPSVGGFSVSDALQDMYDDDLCPALQKESNFDNPHYFGNILPPDGRLTKAAMTPGKYMVARIDGPTVADAMALTDRAKVLGNPLHSLAGESIWFDYYDPVFPSSSDEWYWLKSGVESPELSDLPWMEFDIDAVDAVPHPDNDAFRFAIYRLFDWSGMDFVSSEAGSRVLAFHFNSFGAVTVRSTTAEGGLFVPNALAEGYAAAIGATGEPQCCIAPFPDTLLASLREGWTLGEAYYLANSHDDWMWTLVADPFLQLPNWFSEVESGFGDVDQDGQISARDYMGLAACFGGPEGDIGSACVYFDYDQDGDCDLHDVAAFQTTYTGGPFSAFATGDFDRDLDVDLDDFISYQICQTAPRPGSPLGDCQAFDFDFDLDVDLEDFAAFQASFGFVVEHHAEH